VDTALSHELKLSVRNLEVQLGLGSGSGFPCPERFVSKDVEGVVTGTCFYLLLLTRQRRPQCVVQ
jgi:hypothetical protein